jgi:gamma-glutamyl-gamma-aminobutyrate hydrolase PuuD
MSPRIVVTVADPSRNADPDLARRRNERYAESIRRHGGEPELIDASSSEQTRAAAFAGMDGLLLSGGADLEPARYGEPVDGSREIDVERDELEASAWAAAEQRNVPVLGICRGFQAINVFAGGTLLQDLPGHEGPSWGSGDAAMHAIHVDPNTRFGRLVGAAGDAPRLDVNTYHHQAVRPADLAPGLVAAAWAGSNAGEVVEALEASGDRFVVGVQCHPERTEYSPPELEAVWAAFVAAAAREEGSAAREETPVRR